MSRKVYPSSGKICQMEVWAHPWSGNWVTPFDAKNKRFQTINIGLFERLLILNIIIIIK